MNPRPTEPFNPVEHLKKLYKAAGERDELVAWINDWVLTGEHRLSSEPDECHDCDMGICEDPKHQEQYAGWLDESLFPSSIHHLRQGKAE